MSALDPQKVTVYAADWCPFCRRAKMLLDSKGVDYVSYDTDADPQRKQEMQALGSAHTVPQIFIGEQLVGGYTELAGLEMREQLDGMLAAIK
jgi:glutaredoxin 3